MRLSEAFAQHVSRDCRIRGHEYFASGAVAHVRVDNGSIVATVVGSNAYDVTLTQQGSAVRATCTCPFFSDRLEICKHIWATILAAETRGLPLIAPGPAPSSVTLEPGEPTYDDVLLDDEFIRSFAAGSWTARAPAATSQPRRSAQPPPGPPPLWRQLLDAVAVPGEPPPVGRRGQLIPGQLIYVIDGEATAASGVLVIELLTRDRKANGDWGKPKPAYVSASDMRSLPDGDDRQILERLHGARPHVEYSGYYGHDVDYGLSRLRVSGVLTRELLPRLCATGQIGR